jgi:O-antigen/teichoic acid export membrane protein
LVRSKINSILANNENRNLLRSGLFAIVIRVFGALSGLAATFCIAGKLGAAESGSYFLVFTFVTLISAVSRLGLDNTVLRFVSSSPELAVDCFSKAVALILIFSLLSTILLYVCAPWLAGSVFNKPILEQVIQGMAAGVLGLSMLTVSAMALQGLSRIPASIFILNIAANILLIVFLYIFNVSDAIGLAAVYTVSAVTAGMLGWSLFYMFKPKLSQVKIAWRTLLASCLPLSVAVFMTQVTQWSGQFAAGVYVESELVAQLAVAQRMAMLTSFVLVAINLVVVPRFSALYRDGAVADMEALAAKSVKLVTLFALPIVIVMCVFPRMLMGFFGADFESGAHLLQILAVGQLINAITGSVGYILIMSGNEKDMRNATLASGSLALLLTWYLTMKFGVTGAAFATAAALAAQNIFAAYYVKKRLGFNVMAIWR